MNAYGGPGVTPPLGPTVVFVSDFTMTGSGGIATADAACAAEAGSAGLPNAGTQALLSPGGGMPVAARFGPNEFGGPAERPDGVAIAASLDLLMAGAGLDAPPNVTAARAFVDEDVWLGGPSFATFQSDCHGWTSDSPSDLGTARPAATTRGPTFSQQAACDQPKHVLCVNFNPLVQSARPSTRPRGSRPAPRAP